tara:strand:- start:52 stop:387 length:336 start_codon:yes stop_codon:yes gene_type:complete
MEAKKFLYFSLAANDATCYPLEALRGIDTANGAIHLYFSPQRLTDVAAGDATDRVELTVGTDEKASVKAVVEAITAVGTMKEPFIVIADEENGIYLAKSGITACAGITYAV